MMDKSKEEDKGLKFFREIGFLDALKEIMEKPHDKNKEKKKVEE